MRLGLIVPFRNREDHLTQFIPHITRFFAHHPRLKLQLLIVEQTAEFLFNRGQLLNIGYRILQPKVDWVCFHDVDLLPIIADYSSPPDPSMVIRHVAGHPIDGWDDALFSGVVVLQKTHFEQANGFSNDYWGWGCEDVDLKNRLTTSGLAIAYRNGTFRHLPHVHLGVKPDGCLTPEYERNNQLYGSRWTWNTPPTDNTQSWKSEGLNSLQYKEIEYRNPNHVVVEIGPTLTNTT
jgi:hypothetical protein